MCSRMVQGKRKLEIQDISTIKFVVDLEHYLGFPLVKGRVSRDVYNDVIGNLYYVSLNCHFCLYHFNNLCHCFDKKLVNNNSNYKYEIHKIHFKSSNLNMVKLSIWRGLEK